MAKRKPPGKQQALVPSSARTAAHPDFEEILTLIDAARSKAVAAVNHELVGLYWQIGEYISRKVAGNGWGQGTVATLAEYIRKRQPNARGFSASNLWRMMQFFETYRVRPKLATLSRELSWSHNLAILSRSKRDEEREFYLRMATQEQWSFRELQRQLEGSLFERVVLSPTKVSPPLRELHPGAASVFKDSYLVDVRHDNREGIAGSVSRTLGRRCLSRPTYSPSKDGREHSLLVKRRWATKCPDPCAARLAKYGEGYTA